MGFDIKKTKNYLKNVTMIILYLKTTKLIQTAVRFISQIKLIQMKSQIQHLEEIKL